MCKQAVYGYVLGFGVGNLYVWKLYPIDEPDDKTIVKASRTKLHGISTLQDQAS